MTNEIYPAPAEFSQQLIDVDPILRCEALVEAMARAIYEADDPWHVAWPWPDLQSDQAGVDHYRRCAEAAAAVVQAGLDDRASTSSPVDDSETGNTSDKPDVKAAVKSDTAPVSDKLVEAMALWERADRAGEDAYVEAVQIGVASADDAHKCGAIAAAAVIADALAERDAEIARLREALRAAYDDTPGWCDLARAALGSAKV